jgi:hypothetical protein
MHVIRHPEVPQELEAAALWYEERRPGLGDDFLEEYQATSVCADKRIYKFEPCGVYLAKR